MDAYNQMILNHAIRRLKSAEELKRNSQANTAAPELQKVALEIAERDIAEATATINRLTR